MFVNVVNVLNVLGWTHQHSPQPLPHSLPQRVTQRLSQHRIAGRCLSSLSGQNRYVVMGHADRDHGALKAGHPGSRVGVEKDGGVQAIQGTRMSAAVGSATTRTTRRGFMERAIAVVVGSALVQGGFSNAAAYAAGEDSFATPFTPQTQPGARGTIGGLGNLGLKSPAVTGVYRSFRVDAKGTELDPGTLLDELLGSDGTPILVSFTFPPAWRLSVRGGYCSSLDNCSQGAIDARSMNGAESAFVNVATPREQLQGRKLAEIPPEFVQNFVFSKRGKYGVYGAPEDIRVASDKMLGENRRRIEFRFSAFTPNMRTLAKRCYVTIVQQGKDLFMLVTATNETRWKGYAAQLQEIGDSFNAVPAPKSTRAMSRRKTDMRGLEEQGDFVFPEDGYEE